MGLQALWHDENVRVRTFEILKKCGSPRFVLLNEKRDRLFMALAAMLCLSIKPKNSTGLSYRLISFQERSMLQSQISVRLAVASPACYR